MKEQIKSLTIEDNEPFLRQISKSVDILNDKELKKDINILKQFSIEFDALAMAAVQLGIPKRLIYIRNTNLNIVNKVQNDSITEEEKSYNEDRVLINPVIKRRIGLTEYWEACASCLDNCGRVLRPYQIEVEYFDTNNIKHTEMFEGFESTVLSHEMDHLDGILHIDIAEEILEMSAEERKKWRQTHGYKIYSKTEDYELLKQNFKND